MYFQESQKHLYNLLNGTKVLCYIKRGHRQFSEMSEKVTNCETDPPARWYGDSLWELSDNRNEI